MQIRVLILFVIATIFVTSCASQQEAIVAKYGDFTIPLNEFENAYQKSVGGFDTAKADSLQNYKKFLDLYVNYKMKLRDAFVRGYNNNPELENEYVDYRNNLGETYLLEKKLINPGLKRLYNLRKNEVRASHILVSTQKYSDEEAYKRAEEIINEINNGADFDSLASVYSDDIYTKNKGGDVYYVVAGSILPVLEDAIYSLNVGEVYNKPIKTRFGYHIIKMTEKREYRPSINARHILASVRDSNNVLDTLKSLEKIKEVKAKLDAGEDFGKLAEEYSDDRGSAKKGGDLGSFKRRAMVPQFDEAAFNLKVGETSGIIKTQYGYHIIQVTSEQGYPSFEEDKDDLMKLYKKIRYDMDLAKYIDTLKNEYNFSLDSALIGEIVDLKDSVKFADGYSDSKIKETYGDDTLFEFKDNSVSVDSLMTYASHHNQIGGRIIDKSSIIMAVNSLVQKLILNLKVSLLENEDPEFASLMNDYKNGLYIFKIQEEEIWNKLKLDSNKVHDYYLKHKNDYMWGDRVDYSEIFTKDSAKVMNLLNVIKSGAKFEDMAVAGNEKAVLKSSKGRVGVTNVDANALSKLAFSLDNPGDIAGPVKSGGGWSIIKLNEKLPARVKSFEECKAEVIGAYQEYESKILEDAYINKLNSLYHPVKYYDELNDVFTSEKNNNN